MTLDEFEIGKKCLYCNSEFLCVDKGTKSIVLTQTNNCPKSTYHWFIVGGENLEYCEPIKAKESDPAEEFNVAKKVLLDGVVRIEFRLEDITKAIGEIRLETASIKRSLK